MNNLNNIIDYIKWRGDLSIKQDGLNNLDMLVLARLAYLPLEEIVPEEFDKSISLEEASYEFFIREMQDNVLWKNDPEFLRVTGKSDRFKGMMLSAARSFTDYESKGKFFALTIDLGDGVRCVSYRGTDNSIVGWQEDMSFYNMTVLPSQKKALEYFENVSSEYSDNFLLTGHSKGGNLAIYSAVNCGENIQDKIISIYNFDGPGFDSEVMESDGYKSIKDRVHTFVPQSSVFGMMLDHDEDFSIVKSNSKAIMQHDIYSWEVMGKDFLYLDERTNSSYFINNTLNTLVENMTAEEMNEFINAVFTVIEGSDKETFDEVQKEWYTTYAKMLRSLMTLDKESRSRIFSTLSKVVKSARKNISDITPKTQKKKEKQ